MAQFIQQVPPSLTEIVQLPSFRSFCLFPSLLLPRHRPRDHNAANIFSVKASVRILPVSIKQPYLSQRWRSAPHIPKKGSLSQPKTVLYMGQYTGKSYLIQTSSNRLSQYLQTKEHNQTLVQAIFRPFKRQDQIRFLILTILVSKYQQKNNRHKSINLENNQSCLSIPSPLKRK